ncbi:glycosyltransferase family 2 protein [Rhodopirellula bahusiensis]|uniref:glycosyltransferase family 2 protein n=1 Tax=Rhodopirellula bahusiensis TaxID=2014065 RepID=UPI0032632CB2
MADRTTNLSFASVVIPTFDRYDCLRDTLAFLRKQSDCDYEVLVIDQTPSPKEVAISEEVRYFVQATPSASAARNLGLLHAHGDVVVFLDDDVIIDDDRFLAKHLRHYRDPDVVGVAGAAPEMGQSTQFTRHRFFHSGGIGWAYFPSNQGCQAWLRVGRSNNLSVRRDAAIECGGMDEQFEKGAHREEADFGLRLTNNGQRILYDPFAKLIHIGNASGGIRSWTQNDAIKATHHMVGDLYLMFRHIPFSQRPEYLALSLRYFVFPRGSRTPVRHMLTAINRYAKAWIIAWSKAKQGAQHIDLL